MRCERIIEDDGRFVFAGFDDPQSTKTSKSVSPA